MGHIVFGHGTEKTYGATNIGTVVLERDKAGLADRLRFVSRKQDIALASLTFSAAK